MKKPALPLTLFISHEVATFRSRLAQTPRKIRSAHSRGKKVCYYIFIFLVLASFSSRSALAASDSLYFLHTDHLGSTRAVTDRDGNVVARYDYWPYGTTSNEQLTTDSQITERLYTSQIHDGDTGLYFYNSRYYNPATGTFISSDPLQGPNRYAYVSGNPINLIDPSGNTGVGEPGVKVPPAPWVTHRWHIPSWLQTPAKVTGLAVSFLTPYEISVEDQYLTLRRPYGPQAAMMMSLGMTGSLQTVSAPGSAAYTRRLEYAQEARKKYEASGLPPLSEIGDLPTIKELKTSLESKDVRVIPVSDFPAAVKLFELPGMEETAAIFLKDPEGIGVIFYRDSPRYTAREIQRAIYHEGIHALQRVTESPATNLAKEYEAYLLSDITYYPELLMKPQFRSKLGQLIWRSSKIGK